MSTPTEEDLARWDVLEKAATPGEWRAEREPAPVTNEWFDGLPAGSVPIESTGTIFALGVAVGASPTKADAAFIAEARTAVPALCAALRAAWAERDRRLDPASAQAELARMAEDRDGWQRQATHECGAKLAAIARAVAAESERDEHARDAELLRETMRSVRLRAEVVEANNARLREALLAVPECSHCCASIDARAALAPKPGGG